MVATGDALHPFPLVASHEPSSEEQRGTTDFGAVVPPSRCTVRQQG
jgi:hypothetical protein